MGKTNDKRTIYLTENDKARLEKTARRRNNECEKRLPSS
jgi:hypothetical protein